MSVCVCLSVSLSVCLSVCLSVGLSVGLSVCGLSVSLREKVGERESARARERESNQGDAGEVRVR